jgi:hypothetical protein
MESSSKIFVSDRASRGKTTGAAGIAEDSTGNCEGFRVHGDASAGRDYCMENGVERESSSYQGFIKVEEVEGEGVTE